MTSITDILSPEDIDKAMALVQNPGTFDHKTFFQKTGMTSKNVQQLRIVFDVLDRDSNGLLIEDEISLILVSMKPGSRRLTSAEIEAFIEAAHPIINGQISPAEFEAMVRASAQ
ncbi:parvalbumin beta-like [Dendrobates tinctorius]|uniref:parvalbumin beta-like n=1 Tax=Dendrobates tinctorius TaxID=92724 RepID=UPI003CC9FD29